MLTAMVRCDEAADKRSKGGSQQAVRITANTYGAGELRWYEGAPLYNLSQHVACRVSGPSTLDCFVDAAFAFAYLCGNASTAADQPRPNSSDVSSVVLPFPKEAIGDVCSPTVPSSVRFLGILMPETVEWHLAPPETEGGWGAVERDAGNSFYFFVPDVTSFEAAMVAAVMLSTETGVVSPVGGCGATRGDARLVRYAKYMFAPFAEVWGPAAVVAIHAAVGVLVFGIHFYLMSSWKPRRQSASPLAASTNKSSLASLNDLELAVNLLEPSQTGEGEEIGEAEENSGGNCQGLNEGDDEGDGDSLLLSSSDSDDILGLGSVSRDDAQNSGETKSPPPVSQEVLTEVAATSGAGNVGSGKKKATLQAVSLDDDDDEDLPVSELRWPRWLFPQVTLAANAVLYPGVVFGVAAMARADDRSSALYAFMQIIGSAYLIAVPLLSAGTCMVVGGAVRDEAQTEAIVRAAGLSLSVGPRLLTFTPLVVAALLALFVGAVGVAPPASESDCSGRYSVAAVASFGVSFVGAAWAVFRLMKPRQKGEESRSLFGRVRAVFAGTLSALICFFFGLFLALTAAEGDAESVFFGYSEHRLGVAWAVSTFSFVRTLLCACEQVLARRDDATKEANPNPHEE